MKQKLNSRKFGIIGGVLGLMAFGLALFLFFAGPVGETKPLEEEAVDFALKIKDVVVAKVKGVEYTAKEPGNQWGINRTLELVVIGLGFAAVVFGAIGVLTHGDKRANSLAIGIGAAAIVFQFFVVLAGALVFLMLIFIVLSFLGGA